MKKADLIKFYSIHKTQIFTVIVALSSLFLIIFVIYPQVSQLISNQEAMGNLSRRSKLLETKVTALQSYDIEDLSYKLGIILATLPSDKDIANVLGLLQQLTAKSGFIANSISFVRSMSEAANSSKFEVKLEIIGSKNDFQTLLDNLENSSRLFRINHIEVSSRRDSQILESSLGVEALYGGLPKDFGGVDSPLPEFSQEDDKLILSLEELRQTALTSSTYSAIQSPRGKSNPFE